MFGKKSHNNCNKQRNVCTNAYGWILVTCLILGYISCTGTTPRQRESKNVIYIEDGSRHQVEPNWEILVHISGSFE
uniref:Uncharacterized protein n=1 Tax=Glossina palpalis gambiensis TaxID=67801 RepID=A0A1B0B9W4_9MUSC